MHPEWTTRFSLRNLRPLASLLSEDLAIDLGTVNIVREHLIVHGGLSALRAPAPAITLPDGHKAKVAQIPLQILGRAAALSDTSPTA